MHVVSLHGSCPKSCSSSGGPDSKTLERPSTSSYTHSNAAAESGSTRTPPEVSQHDPQVPGSFVEFVAPGALSYIPVFTTQRTFAEQKQKQPELAAAHADSGPSAPSRCCHRWTAADVCSKQDASAAKEAKECTNQQLLIESGAFQLHSIQLALEHSSCDWQPQPLDTLVAVVGAPPTWLCDSESGSFECWGSSPAAVLHTAPVPGHVPKLCVTVSTVSSPLDSLAVLPLMRPLELKVQEAPTVLLESRHLGEF